MINIDFKLFSCYFPHGFYLFTFVIISFFSVRAIFYQSWNLLQAVLVNNVLGSSSTSASSSQSLSNTGTAQPRPSDSSVGKFGSTVTQPRPSKSDEGDAPKAKCPVCRAEVPQNKMNSHLDECLLSPPPGKPIEI